jgi:hypothetical protein
VDKVIPDRTGCGGKHLQNTLAFPRGSSVEKVMDDFFQGHPSPTRSRRPSEVTAEVPQTDRRPDS